MSANTLSASSQQPSSLKMSETNKNVEKKTKKKENPKWTSDEIAKYLDVYVNYELLWNIRHCDYANKNKRECSMNKLQDDLMLHRIRVPDFTFLRSKIKSIKATYRQEYLKVAESKTTGQGADDVYEPKLSWFSAADAFLRNLTVSRQSTSNLVFYFIFSLPHL